jgi:hypothetical protein
MLGLVYKISQFPDLHIFPENNGQEYSQEATTFNEHPSIQYIQTSETSQQLQIGSQNVRSVLGPLQHFQ